jgi:LacI family transcriptional regulator
MSPPRRVLLAIETSKVYGRGLLDGIGRYAMAHGRWSLDVEERGLDEVPLRLVRAWRGDGILFRSTSRAIVQAIRSKKIPAVDTNSAVIGHGFPLVYTDENRVAELAATHFLERRFRHFGFCSVETARWVQSRREAYLREMARLGLRVHTNAAREIANLDWEQQQQHLIAWLRELPTPIGILAANDVCGVRLIAACRAAGLRIPEQIAILGVDNDDILCRLTSPPLSSIDLNTPAIGYHAASLLDAWMSDGVVATDPVWIPAKGIITRQSTDTLAIEDIDLAHALVYIHEHACDGIDVQKVVRDTGVSRSTLERKMASQLQTTPRQAIVRVQMARVKCLLSETDYSLERIAHWTGYKTQSHLSVAFKREVGMTPGEYRQAHGRMRANQ